MADELLPDLCQRCFDVEPSIDCQFCGPCQDEIDAEKERDTIISILKGMHGVSIVLLDLASRCRHRMDNADKAILKRTERVLKILEERIPWKE